MIDERIYQQFAEIGRDLYEHAMISSHGGNLSLRVGDHVIIKRRGAQLGRLKPHDLVETLIEKNDSGVTIASTELLAHRTIYQQTPALAIVHCHPRTAVAFSFSQKSHDLIGHGQPQTEIRKRTDCSASDTLKLHLDQVPAQIAASAAFWAEA